MSDDGMDPDSPTSSSMQAKEDLFDVHERTKTLVEIRYPTLTPLWAAFTDVEFAPVVRCFTETSTKEMGKLPDSSGFVVPPGAELQALDAGSLRFAIEPALPAKVMLDAVTGVIGGSPLMEHAAGRQYMITARWEASGDIAGRCAVAFAVVSTDIASMCNAAFLGEEPPAFRPHAPSYVAPMAAENTDGSPEEAIAADRCSGLSKDTSWASLPRASLPTVAPTARSHWGQAYPTGDSPPEAKHSSILPGLATRDRQPPVMQRLPQWQDTIQSLSPRKTTLAGQTWRSKSGLETELAPTSTSRTRVFPLGPPLRQRELPAASSVPPFGSGRTVGQQTSLSARGRLQALYPL